MERRCLTGGNFEFLTIVRELRPVLVITIMALTAEGSSSWRITPYLMMAQAIGENSTGQNESHLGALDTQEP
jgi:hypothetical protein